MAPTSAASAGCRTLRRRSAAVLAASAAVFVVSCPLAPPALAETDANGVVTVGGPALASHGLVVDPLPGAPALPKHISAHGWLVADLDTGDILAARDPHGRYLPASTLKTLTAVTLLPRLDPSSVFRATDADAEIDGTRVGLVPRFRYTVRDLFTAMLVMSANDAALALAESYGGVPKTLRAMNRVARHLQAYDTVARTPSGLDARGQSTSAYDLALIAKAGLAMPEFRHYIGIVSANFPAPHRKHYQIYTHDDLLVQYRGAIGVKDGYTVKARSSFVGAATRGGHTLVVTLLRAKPYSWHEAARLLDWGFASLGRVWPVGELVDPRQPGAPPSAPPPAIAPPVKVTATTVPIRRHGVLGMGELAAPVGAGAGVVLLLLAWGIARHRRRRRWRPARRMSLPPI
jgi:D-alanyl-D-alanine carboxypeptidase (penicillin-binding protein 5/6)